MARSEGIPGPTVRRLSLYLRQLELFRGSGLLTVSSKQLGEPLQFHHSQVRKDLAYLGQFGHSGIGYQVDGLINHIRHTLGTDRIWRVALVGAGNLGRALISYKGFAAKGFEIAAVFDIQPPKIASQSTGTPTFEVLSMENLEAAIIRLGVELGILTVPAAVAGEIADRMVRAGVKGILNFAPVMLHPAGNVPVVAVDVAVHLEQLSFHVAGLQR